ncbi:tRNA isopentenyl-2-thiomethyl-A-37 hydroxylase MiaE [Ferrimonas aestuarii]|uniref:tRNA-(Ms[2]io[6]A)-hydroxylase n=1 Tax=Ferrimonas aestuarii TaxID=2569539 RepID=A0A4U1BVG3_9GAMM|nr:tRNA isopentenyl-2-thiomethyl-A-37 hydroxylase MiaE [Ferrimonas aestuarii]TKB58591.1 tRNA-(ms[2]io[6]A)-hydroxylase [Ferrimonas aestuarii]
MSLLEPINQFLHCSTPKGWLQYAAEPEQLPLILRDHLMCELKAAQSAAWLLRRYVLDDAGADHLQRVMDSYSQWLFSDKRADGLSPLALDSATLRCRPQGNSELLEKMLRLIREELHHFMQVLEILESKGIEPEPMGPSGYASGLMSLVRTYEPQALVDKLIIGAFIEARSCERFAALAPHLEPEIERFYMSLLRSEARHFQDYLTLAEAIEGGPIDERIAEIGAKEASLIQSSEDRFRFHSGVPA